jgi:hypothetical protein
VESHHGLISLFEHDLFGKPVPTFPDHALARSQIRIDASLGQVVGREFVVSGRDTPTLFDLVEEPFDQVTRANRYGLKQIRVFSISFRPNVGPCSLLAGKADMAELAGGPTASPMTQNQHFPNE